MVHRKGKSTSLAPSLGDGAVNVGDDHLVIPFPQIDGGCAAARALVLGGHAEDYIIGPFLQVQSTLKSGRRGGVQ